MPIDLEYTLQGDKQVDYFIYYPRNGNGNFGAVDVYVQTADNPNYVLAGTYDFGQQGGFDGKTGILTKTVKATKVKITVKTGLGGFASCGEMEFLKKQTTEI